MDFKHLPDAAALSGPTMLADEIGVAILLVGKDDGLIKYVNKQVCKDLGKQRDDLVGQSYKQIFWPEFIPVYKRLRAKCKDGNQHTAIYYWTEKKIWEQISMHFVHAEKALCALITITNISEIALTQYIANNNIYFNNLLKLPNGAKLEEDINDLASVETVSLLYFTMSNLRGINNLYGWDNGDRLLVQVRDWILNSEPRRAQVYCLENGFAILGRGVNMEDVIDRANSIVDRFEQPWAISAGGRKLFVYCSIKLGIVYGKYVKNEMRNLLLRTIESAPNSLKYVIYSEEVDKQAKRELLIRDSLINCIHNGMQGFEVHYQPIIETETGHWVGLEALCRWTMPDGSKVPPDVFIHVAEQLGLIDKLDAWVRQTAMRQCIALDLHKKKFILNVNFSPTQKISQSFIENLRKILSTTGFPAEKLNMEITESSRMIFDEENIQGLQHIANEGVCLSLDDFGTGYSSLEYLINISAHYLKIDKLFLDGIVSDKYKQYLLQMMIELSKYLKMQLIAEGIEEEEQFHLLKSYGVGLIQGYLFSKPLGYKHLKKNIGRFVS